MSHTSWKASGRRLLGPALAAALVAGSAAVAASPAEAGARSAATGTRSLATVLAADSGFDRNRRDFDVLEGAVAAVLGAKPGSSVAVLADGRVALTAFLPTDRAFRHLANDVLGRERRGEAEVLGDLAAALPIDTIEAVLLYHVVPGATIDYRTAKSADGATLATALAGATLRVNVKRCAERHCVKLVDGDPDARNGHVVKRNINKGNRQIAHGVNRVLRPVDL